MAKVSKLFRFEQCSGVLMIAALLLALVSANSPIAPVYNLIHHTPVHFRFGWFVVDAPLVQWINEGLMVIFFLIVGLEIKRAFLEGSHAKLPQIVLPAVAALGGMVLPAAVYLSVTANHPNLTMGWAIPTATDVVLALGILSFLGRRVPPGLKIFLTALAIFDDIGAVLIIGLFYGEGLAFLPLLIAAAAILGLAVANARRVPHAFPYVALGILLWGAMLKSGLQPALAGVIIAFSVPMRVRDGCCFSPVRKMERCLHPWVALVVVPLFAFFNAGISFEGLSFGSLISPVSFGVAAGLFLGKQVGVLGAAWIAVRVGAARLPDNSSWLDLHGIALLAGIGFTMSLFVSSLAFADSNIVISAKLAILTGSTISALAGVSVLFVSYRAKAAGRRLLEMGS